MAAVLWSGLDDLRTALRNLPAHLAQEAATIVTRAADEARATMAADYAGHVVTGNLSRGLTQRAQSLGPYGVGVEIRNTSPHAWMVENGTEARHTSLGFNRGKMPALHVMLPTAIRRRAQMYHELKDVLLREGLTVTGDAP